jgi:RNA polymerase sigma-70 factor, ECF subfamily
MGESGNSETASAVVVGLEPPGDEAEMIERAKTQPEAFGRLYEAYYGRILSYAYRRTLDTAVAEEITSNTFFNALRALPAYDSRGKFGAWLYRIATNDIRLRRRSQRNRPESSSRWREEFCRVHFAPHWAVAAEDREERMYQFAQLHHVISCLPDRYQAVLALRYFEGMPCAEIADVLGKRIGTVKSLIHRGLERLKRQIETDGTTFPAGLKQQMKKE